MECGGVLNGDLGLDIESHARDETVAESFGREAFNTVANLFEF